MSWYPKMDPVTGMARWSKVGCAEAERETTNAQRVMDRIILPSYMLARSWQRTPRNFNEALARIPLRSRSIADHSR